LSGIVAVSSLALSEKRPSRRRRENARFIQSGRIVSGGGNGFPMRKPAHSTQNFVQLAEPDFSQNSEIEAFSRST
jgi:hypothetical protein